MRTPSLLCTCVLLAACGPTGPAPGSSVPAATAPAASAEPPPSAEVRFQREAEAFYWAQFAVNPHFAVLLGHHQYDGKLPDVSPAGLQAAETLYTNAKATFEGVPAAALSRQSRLEREVLLAEIRAELFRRTAWRLPHRSPLVYLRPLSLTPYVTLDYAPLEVRARGIMGVCDAMPSYLSHAQNNLPRAIPRTWLQNGLLRSSGMVEFIKTDVPKAMAGLEGPAAKKLSASLDRCATALQGFHDWMKARLGDATDDFALGKELFLRMLADKEGVETTIEQLVAIGEADLERNLKAARQIARQIDPNSDVRAVFEAVKADKPPATGVLAAASQQAAELRQLLLDKQLVTIPSDDIAEARETPAFMRWNAAFLRSAGPFETKPLPSFYYISPPDPTWPPEKQQAYLPSHAELLFTTVHELWPGHFLHALHEKKNPSKILKSFWSYSMGEGWAHYAEEMMWNAGAGGGDPRMHLGQLGEALLRNVRFKAAIALHAQGATVDQAREWFETLAYSDRATAEQQAVRGTFDPGYLNYTLGKLMILKLRDDYQARVGGSYSLRQFHDTLLSYGTAPLPAIRREMLGEDAGPAL